MEQKNVSITLLNLPTANRPKNEKTFKYLEGAACDLSNHEESSFDIVHSNSVLEHIGDWSRMLLFAKEVKRVSKSYYVQTPNYWFPIESHFMIPFFHWLPKSLIAIYHEKYHPDNEDWTLQPVSYPNNIQTSSLENLFYKEVFRRERII